MEFTEAKKGLVSGLYSFISRDGVPYLDSLMAFRRNQLIWWNSGDYVQQSDLELDKYNWKGLPNK